MCPLTIATRVSNVDNIAPVCWLVVVTKHSTFAHNVQGVTLGLYRAPNGSIAQLFNRQMQAQCGKAGISVGASKQSHSVGKCRVGVRGEAGSAQHGNPDDLTHG